MNRFFAFILVFTASAACPFAEAVAADLSAVKMTLSANENYLRRFRKEAEALSGATDSESAKKRESLNKKIKNLEAENARLANALKKNGKSFTAAVPAKTIPPPVAAPVRPAAIKPAIEPPAPNVPPAPALTGAAVSQWEKMSREKKEEYVNDLVGQLKREGRFVQRHPLFYTALMDYVFVSDADLAAKPLKDAVVATIQKNEKAF